MTFSRSSDLTHPCLSLHTWIRYHPLRIFQDIRCPTSWLLPSWHGGEWWLKIASIFRSSVKIKPFVTVLESPRLLVRVSQSNEHVPSTISCGWIWLGTQGEIPLSFGLKRDFLSFYFSFIIPPAIKAVRAALKHQELLPAMTNNVLVVLLTQFLLGVGYILAKVFSG